MELFERKNWLRFVPMVGCCLIHLTLGNVFTAGNLSPYVMSYLKARVDPRVEDSLAVWITSLSVASLGLPMFLGGYMERKFGARITCLCGGSLFCGSIALSYLAIQHSFLAFLCTYAFACYCGASLSYVTTIATAMKCFPRNKSLASGAVLAFYGLGPLVLNQLETALINPQNVKVDKNTGYFLDEKLLNAVPRAFLFMSLIYSCIQLVGIAFLYTPELKARQEVFTLKMNHVGSIKCPNSDSEKVTRESFPAYGENSKDFTPVQMLRRKEFYMFWVTFALLIQNMLFVSSYYKIYGQKYSDDKYLTSLGSGAAVFNFLGRIFWGYFMDKFSYKTSGLLISVSGAVFVSTFFLTGPVDRVFFSVWVLVLFFLIAGMVSLVPVAVAVAFGPTYSSVNFGIIFTSPAAMSLCGATLMNYFLQTFSWMGTCCILGAFNLAAFGITLFLPFDLSTIRKSPIVEQDLSIQRTADQKKNKGTI